MEAYIVSNGSGSGETRASQTYMIAQALADYGSTNPNTGSPTTSTVGTSGSNGTWLAFGERGQASTNQWSALAVKIGNVGAIQSDITDNWALGVAGGAGALTLDGLNLSKGARPGVSPA